MNEHNRWKVGVIATLNERKSRAAAHSIPVQDRTRDEGSSLGWWLGWLLLLAPLGLILGVRPLLRALEHQHLLLVLGSVVILALFVITASVARNYTDERIERRRPK
jgi:hypothetical protein